MRDVSLDDLKAFAAVARHRNFRRAALERSVSASSISLTVRRLEDRLGVALLNRTTRSVSPTAAGERLLESLAPAFERISGALNEVDGFRALPTGLVRITAPKPVAQLMLAPIINDFLIANPMVSVEITADDALVDVVEQGYDAGVRFGESLHQDMIAARLGPPRRMLIVGAPAYIAAHGMPTSVEELSRLSLIRHRFPGGAIFDWDLERDGGEVTITPGGMLTVNDPHIKMQAAIDGVGLAFEFEGYALEALASGALVAVMEDWCPYFPAPYIYFPSSKNMSAAVRAFIDHVRSATAAVARD